VKNNLWNQIFEEATATAFALLQNKQILNCNFSAEDTTFLRLNKSKIRQASEVEQASIDLELYEGNKRTSHTINLSKDSDQNRQLIQSTLKGLQKEIEFLPADPFLTALSNNGNSSVVNEGQLPTTAEFVDFIAKTLTEVDLAGIFVSGQNHRGNANSLGQKHWFTSTSFFFDYSLYSAKEKAIKGSYGGSNFKTQELMAAINESIQALKVMDREQKVITPGKYRCYLAPAAVQELLGIFQWNALSGGAYKRGTSGLTELADKKKKLSEKFSLIEDFSLGLSPRFNERGEVFAERLSLINKGELANFLVSSMTEKEYGIKSNFASGDESQRSAVIQAGKLKRENILKELGTGLYISNLHYLNWSDQPKGRVTGMTRFGCLWVENGEIQGPIKDLRFDETLYQIFGDGLIELTDFVQTHVETSTYGERQIGGSSTPGILVQDMNFTL
jgi:predicted Zn-dependent protease